MIVNRRYIFTFTFCSEFYKDERSGKSKLVIKVCMFKLRTLQVFKSWFFVAKMSKSITDYFRFGFERWKSAVQSKEYNLNVFLLNFRCFSFIYISAVAVNLLKFRSHSVSCLAAKENITRGSGEMSTDSNTEDHVLPNPQLNKVSKNNISSNLQPEIQIPVFKIPVPAVDKNNKKLWVIDIVIWNVIK